MSDYNYLRMNINATLFDRGTVRIYIDGTVIYIAQYNNISGVSINQNISSYSGNHTITINFEQSNLRKLASCGPPSYLFTHFMPSPHFLTKTSTSAPV